MLFTLIFYLAKKGETGFGTNARRVQTLKSGARAALNSYKFENKNTQINLLSLKLCFFMQNNTQKKRILFLLLLLFWHIMHLFFVKEQITIKMFFLFNGY